MRIKVIFIAAGLALLPFFASLQAAEFGLTGDPPAFTDSYFEMNPGIASNCEPIADGDSKIAPEVAIGCALPGTHSQPASGRTLVAVLPSITRIHWSTESAHIRAPPAILEPG